MFDFFRFKYINFSEVIDPHADAYNGRDTGKGKVGIEKHIIHHSKDKR